MPTEQEFQQLVSVVDQQKGEPLFLQALLLALMHATQPEFQATVYQHFLRTAESTRQTALFSQASEDVISAFEHYVEALKNQSSK